MQVRRERKTPGAFEQRFVPAVGPLAAYIQNILIPGVGRGGGGGGGLGQGLWTQLELTDA